MTSTEAINRIKNLLFSKQSFGLMKTDDGTEVTFDGELEVEKEIYIITPNGEIPAPEGKILMEDGLEVEVKDGKITSMNYPTNVEEEKMVQAELIDGTIVETDTDEIKVGDKLFVITPEGRSEAPNGEHPTKDGKVVVVLDGIVTEIKEALEDTVVEEMTEDTLADGTKVVTDEEGKFDIGQQLYFITKEDEKVPALAGEHTTSSGIVITTDSNGVITGVKYPDQEGEGSLSDFDKLMDLFTKGFEKLNSDIEELKTKNNQLQENFSKFSAEPAGERLYFQKDLINHLKETRKTKLEALATLKRK